MKDKQVAQFRLIDAIGEGGMGEVWLAHDTRLDRKVALKFLGRGLLGDATARERFLREARSAGGLDHPFICSIFEVGEDDEGRAFIAMEYVRGETLEQRLGRAPLSLPEALRLACELAEALECAHERGIIHRDLKPANVMLTEGGRIKVMDFGLSKRVGQGGAADPDADTMSQLTRAGSTLGTPGYMSPEQLRGQALDARSDVFALGIILYRMVAGVHPFGGASPYETASAILTREPDPIGRHVAGPPAGLDRVVRRMLAKKREDRPASAAEVLRDLTTLMDQSSATGATSTRRMAAPPESGGAIAASRRRWLVPAAVAVAVGALTVLVVALPSVRRRVGGWLSVSEPATSGTRAGEDLSPFELYRTGVAYLDRWDLPDNIERAIASFRKAIERDPTHAAALAGLGEAYRRKTYVFEDPTLVEQALRHTGRAVELDPHLAVARVWHGLALLDANRTEEARAELEEALRIDPTSARAQLGLADLLERGGRTDEARSAYEKALELDPGYWETYASLGALHFNAGRYEEAEQVYSKGIEIAPDNPQLYFNLAAACQMQNRYDDAAAYYQKSLEISPSANAYSNLGTLFFFQGRYGEAATAYEHAVELNAGSYMLWANLADAYRWTPGRADEANEAYAVAVRLAREELEDHPDDATLLGRLATFHAKAGQPDEALALQERVDRLGSENLNVLYRSVLVYEIAGARDRALFTLERALQAGYPLSEARRDPELLELRNDPRFQRMVTRLGL